MSISLCMIVKDEENNLPRCLKSVRDIVDEIIIVDTGSIDSTVEIAKSFGAKVYDFEWNGSFSDARNYSLEKANGNWIMIMDADDEMSEEGKQAIPDLIANGDADAYFFETISYVGDKPGTDVLKNMNLRLMKNGKGYHYSNPIHEQIYCNIKALNPSAKIVNKDIKVYHYGYLNKNIIEHNKRARNIGLLEKELKAKPGSPFTLFNLGSEYYAMGDNVKAIDYFEKAFRKFNVKEGFSSHLILKMTHCYLGLGRYDDAFDLCCEGLSYYPQFTDLEFLKGVVKNTIGKHFMAIKHFEKCCEMGEAPNNLNVIIGSGTYKPYMMLGNIYYTLEEYELAAENYKISFGKNTKLKIALSMLIKSYCKMEIGNKALEGKIEDMRPFCTEEFDSAIFEILMQEKYHDLALVYIKKFEEKYGESSYSQYYKGCSKLYFKKYKVAFGLMAKCKKDPEYFVRAVCIQALCRIIEKDISKAQRLLHVKGKYRSDAMIKVYRAFLTIMEMGEVPTLSSDETEANIYTPIIFDILKTLLIIHQFEIFEKALDLLNCIDDKTVLLKLARLYYNENCFGLAFKEFNRSIKVFDCIDLEGSKMLYNLKYKGF